MTKAESVLFLARERCSVAEIACGLGMRLEHVSRIVHYGWWPIGRRGRVGKYDR